MSKTKNSTRTFLAVALAAASFSASASQFYITVPVPGKKINTSAINVALSAASLPDGLMGAPYSEYNLKTLLSVTGDPDYSGYGVKWQMVDGALPAGLTMGTDGRIHGTPTAGGTASFKVKATYKTKSGLQQYQILVTQITVALAGAALPGAVVGDAYSYDLKPHLSVVGGNAASATWQVVSSTLPSGLTLRADGTIAGTPTAAGSGSVTARAIYSGISGQQTYEVVTLYIVVALAPATLPPARTTAPYVGYDFKNNLTVSGDPDYKASDVIFTSTGLPAGLALSPAGLLSGAPTIRNNAGASFNVVASYKTKSGQRAYTLVVKGEYLEATKIAAGNTFACALTTTAGVKCWGSGGTLGDGTMSQRSLPVDVQGLTSGVVHIAAGGDHACAVTSAGGVKCWGQNGTGQLGNSSTTASLIPVDVSGLTGVSTVSVGWSHACAVTASGGAVCWGANSVGQLGNNSTTRSLVPTQVTGLASGVAQIAASQNSTCALTTSGGVLCWGANYLGQLGFNGTTNSSVPGYVSGFTSGARAVAFSGKHGCAITTANGLKCWGNNDNGQLGNNNTVTSSVPVNVIGSSSNVAKIAVGGNFSCMITTAGAALCWGQNGWGQQGDGTYVGRLTPGPVSGLASGVTDISVGDYFACAVTPANAWCWGANGSGQLGDNTTLTKTTPVGVRE